MLAPLKHTILLCIFLLSDRLSFGQHEFLITIDPASGSFTMIDSLPEVHWIATLPRFSTFDEQNHRYIFSGAHIDYSNFLYSVDAVTGEIVYSPPFPQLDDPNDNIAELRFDSQLNMLFGLHWDASEMREYFVSVDVQTGVHTKIDSIPNVQAIASGSSTYDPVNHLYFFSGENHDGTHHNYVIDALSGATLSDAGFIGLADPLDNISHMCYDYAVGKMYGLHWDNSAQKEFMVSVDSYTGIFEVLFEIPGVRYIVAMPNYHTYNVNDHVFIFQGLDENMNRFLFSVDTQSGEVIAHPSFPQLSDPNDNIIELVYDNSGNHLYALSWNNSTGSLDIPENVNSTGITVYPNPFTENCSVRLNRKYDKISAFLIDPAGKIVRQLNYSDSDEISFPRGSLPAGHYYLSVIADNNRFEIQNLIIK